MKRSYFLILAFVIAAVSVQAQDAASIVRSSRNRIQADTTSTRSRMVITARGGSTTERLIDQYSKDGPNGARSVIVFQQPANVAGTRFLTMRNSSGTDDRWIFLPELGRVRRIAASEGSGSFMGTDFSYDDISATSRSVDLDDHTLAREETLVRADGTNAACYVIESVPNDSSFQYSKMVQWIAKDTYIIYQIELYDRRNTLVKTVEMSGIQNIQGRQTVTVTKIITHAAGTSTTLTNEIVRYDDNIPEGVFTTQYLETGRPR